MNRTFVYSTITVLLIALVAPEIAARGGGGGGGGSRGGSSSNRSRGSVRYSDRQKSDRSSSQRDDRARTDKARTDRASADRAAASKNTKKAQAARHQPAKRSASAKGRTVRNVPRRGHRVTRLPAGYHRRWWRNRRWYYYGGIWYEEDDDDDDEEDSYIVTLPPLGVTVSKVPEGAEKIKVDGKTQYVFAGIYYKPLWVSGKVMYEVVKVDKAAFDAAVKASAAK